MLAMGNSLEGISVQNFKKYVVQSLKCDLTETSLELFIKSDEALNHDPNFIAKHDLIRLLEEPFKVARIRL